ncbi:MAG: hypothetical protein Fur0012_11290 [Elusimicrobiota bacterium]
MGFEIYGENKIHKDGVLSASVHNSILATSSEDDTVAIWKLPELELLAQIKAHETDVKKVVFSPDGRLLISCSSSGDIRLWNAADLSLVKTLKEHSGEVGDITFLAGGELLSASDDQTAKLWSLDAKSSIKTLKPGIGDVNACAAARDKILLGGSHLLFLDNSLSTLKKSDEYIYGINRIKINGELAFVSTSMEKTLEIWDLKNLSMLKKIRNSSWINDICFYKDKTILAMGEYLKTLNSSFETENELEAHGDEIYALAVYSDFLISGANDSSLKIWKIN